MQDSENIKEGKKSLYCYYIAHMLFYSLIMTLLMILYYEIYWLNKIILILYLFGTYFGVIFLLFPIFPLYSLKKNGLNSKILECLRVISIICVILNLIIGLMISAVFFINTKYSIEFSKECPFTYSLSHLNYSFNYFNNNYKKGDIKNKCSIERCILYKENINEFYGYSYLCNYNPFSDLYSEVEQFYTRELPNGTVIASNKKFMCYELESNYKDMLFNKENNDIFINYISTCFYSTKFYLCQRFDEPKYYYDMKNNKICPDDDYLFFLYIICLLLSIIEILVSLLLWCIEYSYLKELLIIVISNTNKKNNSIYSTRSNTDKTTYNSNSYNIEPTLVIVMPLNERNNNNINNITNNNSNINNNRLIIKNSEDCASEKKISVDKDIKIIFSCPESGNSERVNLHKKQVDIDLTKNNDSK